MLGKIQTSNKQNQVSFKHYGLITDKEPSLQDYAVNLPLSDSRVCDDFRNRIYKESSLSKTPTEYAISSVVAYTAKLPQPKQNKRLAEILFVLQHDNKGNLATDNGLFLPAENIRQKLIKQNTIA